MDITKPNYYDSFRCIAGACPDSCCKEWAVQVDAEAAARYRAMPGSLGDRLREVLKDEDGETIMTIVEGKCPMWRDDHLCRIHAELGEDALCHVCHEFPRLRHDYGDFLELGLELSCPEAARLILNAKGGRICQTTPESGAADYDIEAMASLKATRDTALEIVSSEAFSPAQALALLLFYGYQAQEELDGGEQEHFNVTDALQNARDLAKPGNLREFLNFFLGLEILTPQWEALLRQEHTVALPELTKPLTRYLIDRYWLQAITDYDLISRVKFILISCILVGTLGGNYAETAQLFSKEIENDADNVDTLLDAVYTCTAFTDDKLLGMVRASEECIKRIMNDE